MILSSEKKLFFFIYPLVLCDTICYNTHILKLTKKVIRMTSLHNAPYATKLGPKFEVGDEVYSSVRRRYVTVYGVRAIRQASGDLAFYYSFADSTSPEVDFWHAEKTIQQVGPYVRDRLGYCVYLGNTVHDLMARHGSGELVVIKIDAPSKRCFLKRSPTSSFGYWCKASDLCKVADCYYLD